MAKNKYLSQILIAIGASVGSLIYGISLGWSSPAIPKLLKNSDFDISIKQAAWSASMLSLGATFSCVLAGIIRDKFGTKTLIAIYSVPSITGWFLLIFSLNAWMVIIGRFLIGIAGGGYAFIVPIYIGEIASKEIRGSLLAIYEITVKTGILTIYIIASVTDLIISNTICAIIVISYFLIAMCLPESPVYLLRKNKFESAKKSLKILYCDRNSEHEFNPQVQVKNKAFMDEMNNEATQKAFLIIFMLFAFFQACGINACLFYLTTIFIESNIEVDPFLSTIILGVMQLVGVFIALTLVDRSGRKFLLILSFSFMIVGHIGIGSFFHAKAFGVKFFEWLPLISLCIYFIGFSLGVGSVTYILLGELFSSSAKKIVAPLAQTVNFFSSFGVTLIFPIISSIIGIYFMFYAFAVFCFLGILFVYFFLPETKGKSLDEIQAILVGKNCQ